MATACLLQWSQEAALWMCVTERERAYIGKGVVPVGLKLVTPTVQLRDIEF